MYQENIQNVFHHPFALFNTIFASSILVASTRLKNMIAKLLSCPGGSDKNRLFFEIWTRHLLARLHETVSIIFIYSCFLASSAASSYFPSLSSPRNLSRPKRHKSSPRTCHPPSDVVPNGPDPPVTWREDKAYLQEANGGRFGTGDQWEGGQKTSLEKKTRRWLDRGFLDFPIPFFLGGVLSVGLVVSFRGLKC